MGIRAFGHTTKAEVSRNGTGNITADLRLSEAPACGDTHENRQPDFAVLCNLCGYFTGAANTPYNRHGSPSKGTGSLSGGESPAAVASGYPSGDWEGGIGICASLYRYHSRRWSRGS